MGNVVPDKKKVRLLVVDDQPEYFEFIQEFSEICSHVYDIVCTYADTGEKAFELIRTWEPSIVLVDVHTANLDCFEFLDRCKRGAQPVIAVSNEQSKEIERSVLAKGATAYLPKTENPDEMESLLQEIISFSDELPEAH